MTSAWRAAPVWSSLTLAKVQATRRCASRSSSMPLATQLMSANAEPSCASMKPSIAPLIWTICERSTDAPARRRRRGSPSNPRPSCWARPSSRDRKVPSDCTRSARSWYVAISVLSALPGMVPGPVDEPPHAMTASRGALASARTPVRMSTLVAKDAPRPRRRCKDRIATPIPPARGASDAAGAGFAGGARAIALPVREPSTGSGADAPNGR
jgi:hypothetical protein